MNRYKFYIRVRVGIVEVFFSADNLTDALQIAEAQYGADNIVSWTTIDESWPT